MKKVLTLLLIASVLVSCGERKKKKKFSYNVPKEVVTTSIKEESNKATEEPPANLSNKGIGSIKNLELGDINQDMVAKGKALYNKSCTACHLIDKKLIGPALRGVTKKRSPEWIMNLMLNTQQMLKEDPIARKLLEIYKTPMINNNMTEQETREVLEYLRIL